MSRSAALLDSLRETRTASLTSVPACPGRPVGLIGDGIPRELVVAAGLHPTRIHSSMGSTNAADEYLGRGTEPWIRAVLSRFLDGTLAGLPYLIIANDGEATRRLFHYLSVLKKHGRTLPELHFLDVQPQSRVPSLLYSILEMERLRDALGEWTGTPVSDTELRRAIKQGNASRALLRELFALRCSNPVRLSGADALLLMDAENYLSTAQQLDLYEGVLSDAVHFDPVMGVPVYITGSPIEHDWVYNLVESAGGVVVGEDHDWGGAQLERAVEEDTDDPLKALAAAYALHLTPSMVSLTERVRQTAARATATPAAGVLCLVLQGDPTPAWDYPEQSAALQSAGLPTILIDGISPDTAAASAPIVERFIHDKKSTKVPAL